MNPRARAESARDVTPTGSLARLRTGLSEDVLPGSSTRVVGAERLSSTRGVDDILVASVAVGRRGRRAARRAAAAAH